MGDNGSYPIERGMRAGRKLLKCGELVHKWGVGLRAQPGYGRTGSWPDVLLGWLPFLTEIGNKFIS